MTSREQEMCMLIQSKEYASLSHLSKVSGLGTAYIELIIQRLVENGFINYRGKKSCYLTAKGKSFVGKKNNKKKNKGVQTITRPLSDILKSIHLLTGKKYK